MKTVPRRDFLKTLCAGGAALSLTGGGFSGRNARPNIVLVMTDDQGYGDLGIKGNLVIQTPNIDAMARRSAEMKCFYVSPVCSPTRACLMTGRYNYRTRCIDTYIGRSMMDPEEVTLAEILRDSGYATGIFGKWHLGDNHPMRPIDQGFEESLVHRGGGIGQPADPPGGEGKYTDAILFHNGKQVETRGYCTDVYFNTALGWIENCVGAGKNFFAYIPTNAPHGPFHDVPEELLKMYQQADLGNERFPQDQGHKLPEKVNVDTRARIFAMISNVDENVGKLFKKLEALKITDNTLVIFMVDNGPNSRRYVAGMRGMKSEVYEGGIRSPFFMHLPAVLEPGRSSDRVAAHIDVLPSLLDACGIPVPRGLQLDGRSFLPLLKGDPVDWPDRTLYIQTHRGDVPVKYHHFAARSQRWKLLHPSGFGRENFEGEPRFELYDMGRDPLEMKDLAKERPDVVRKMVKDYEKWFEDVSTTRRDNYAPPRIHVGTTFENPVVLTRQDWRHTKGRPWAGDSNGHWELFVASEGPYRIRLRFPEAKAAAEVELKIAGQTLESTIKKGDRSCSFDSVSLAKGEARLEAVLIFEDGRQGPYQVDVVKNE